MVGAEPAPVWLEIDWVLGQFGEERMQARAGYAAFVREGVGQPSVWDGLRHQVFLGSEPFVERHCIASTPRNGCAKCLAPSAGGFAKPLSDFAGRYPVRREAMARAYQTGVYSMQEIADYFGVHYSTVSRAVSGIKIRECFCGAFT